MHKILILDPLADNLHSAPTPFLALPDHRVVSLEGPDAVAFAHAQFANDVAGLAVDHWQWNTWLTPKGRVIAVFALARRDDQTLWVILPDYPADAFVSQLQQFVFRRKLKMSVRHDLSVSGAMEAPRLANSSRLGVSGDEVELDLATSTTTRHWRIGIESGIDSDAMMQHWRTADLRHGLPRLSEKQREQWTPQQLSLDRLNAYSIKKGCYPGQEIVARTHFLGKTKRGLRLLQSDGPLRAGSKVETGNVDLGELISVAGADQTLALAVMPLDIALDAATVEGMALTELPLAPGLAR